MENGRGFEICKRRESQGHVKVALHEITVTSRLGRRRFRPGGGCCRAEGCITDTRLLRSPVSRFQV